MADNESDEGQPELAAVLPLPVRTDPGPLSPADLAEAMLRDGADLRDAMRNDPAWPAMMVAFGLEK